MFTCYQSLVINLMYKTTILECIVLCYKINGRNEQIDGLMVGDGIP